MLGLQLIHVRKRVPDCFTSWLSISYHCFTVSSSGKGDWIKHGNYQLCRSMKLKQGKYNMWVFYCSSDTAYMWIAPIAFGDDRDREIIKPLLLPPPLRRILLPLPPWHPGIAGTRIPSRSCSTQPPWTPFHPYPRQCTSARKPCDGT